MKNDILRDHGLLPRADSLRAGEVYEKEPARPRAIEVREDDLQKILAVLERNRAFHAARDSMNAELHMEVARPSRLAEATKHEFFRLEAILLDAQTQRMGDKLRI